MTDFLHMYFTDPSFAVIPTNLKKDMFTSASGPFQVLPGDLKVIGKAEINGVLYPDDSQVLELTVNNLQTQVFQTMGTTFTNWNNPFPPNGQTVFFSFENALVSGDTSNFAASKNWQWLVFKQPGTYQVDYALSADWVATVTTTLVGGIGASFVMDDWNGNFWRRIIDCTFPKDSSTGAERAVLGGTFVYDFKENQRLGVESTSDTGSQPASITGVQIHFTVKKFNSDTTKAQQLLNVEPDPPFPGS